MAATANDQKLKVDVVDLGRGKGFYFVGDMSFDEQDRDLAYIDKQIATWLTWRGWVVENGEWGS